MLDSLLGPANVTVLNSILISCVLAISVYLPLRAGLIALSVGGFAALGGYTTAVLTTDEGLHSAVGLLSAVLVGAVFAGAVGAIVMRIAGVYLALGSIALTQFVLVLISNLDITHGVFGIYGIPVTVDTPLLLAIVACLCVVLQLFERTHFVRALRLIRLDRDSAASLGVNVARYQLITFVLSGALGALGGALNAHRISVVSPELYGFPFLVTILVFVMVGGPGHWSGVVAAVAGITVLREALARTNEIWESLTYGILLVAVAIFFPSGLSGRSAITSRVRRACATFTALAWPGKVRTKVEGL